LSFDGDQYPNTAAKVITTRGDIVRGNSSGDRERYGIGAANTVLTSDGTDPDWAAAALAPTTTKGDISGYTTTQARIPISTNNYSLFADSAQALGLKWAASPTSTLTTTGDLLAASAANVLTRIAGGDSGEILTGNGAGVLPTFQAAGGGVTTNSVTSTITSSFTTTSTTFVEATDFSLVLSNQANGLASVSGSGKWENTTADANCNASLADDGATSGTATACFGGRAVGRYMNALSITGNFTTDGSTIALYVNNGGSGTCNIAMGATTQGQLKAFEVY
jgi:hypothetical protein